MMPRPWQPSAAAAPPKLLDTREAPSAWAGIESALGEIVVAFGHGVSRALEFGVEWGYSAVALSNYFDVVVGVDPLLQESPAGFAEATYQRLRPYANVVLVRTGWELWAKAQRGLHARYDLVHVDIDPHDYAMTYAAGMWAALHSPLVIFHDTQNTRECWTRTADGPRISTEGTEVTRAVGDIAAKLGREFWEWKEAPHGLGILAGG